MWDYSTEHFQRYINWEFWINNYEEIIKTGFGFPKIFIACIKCCYKVNNEKRDKLLDAYYQKPQNENDYYSILKLIEFTEKYPEFKDLIKHFALNYPNSVALIFSRQPSRWGLRGDPYFWTYLEESCIKYSIPINITEFEDIIGHMYFKISGKMIGERSFIKEFDHGGMSSGSVSENWLDFIHLLKYRLIKLNNKYFSNHEEYSKIIKNPENIIKTTDKSLDKILEEYDKQVKIFGL